MYQNSNNLPPYINGGYYQQIPYSVPYQQQQRYEINNAVQQNYQIGNYLKGRPVVSLEEARASQIDLDGSLHIFTDLANKKIYTKQINLDGTATLNVYSLEEENQTQQVSNQDYVTRAEFEQALNQIQSMFVFSNPKEEEDKKNPITLNNF